MATTHASVRSCIVGSLSCQKDSYLTSLDTEVVSCVKSSDSNGDEPTPKIKPNKSKKSSNVEKHRDDRPADPTWLIEFNDSVLFPEGGGQPSDYGTLISLKDEPGSPIKVKFVERQGLHCVVHSPQPLAPGTSVRQQVDFERRWDLMQQHTGQHLLTAIMNTYDNLKTLGWGMGAADEMSYVDLPRKPSDEELQEIQKKVNDTIQQNIRITVETSSNANVDKLPDDYDQDQGVVRVIKIGDLDRNTCCGTHLQQTSHMGLLLLGHNQANSGGRTRQFFIAGNRAIKLATSSLNSTRTISRLLSSSSNGSADELVDSVTKLQDSVATMKKREAKLLSDVADYEIERVKALLADGKNAYVHRPEPGMDFVNIVAAGVKDVVGEGNVVILSSGEGSTGGAVVVVGKKDVVEGYVGKVKEAFSSIKGGGKGERWQGKMLEWRNGDLEKLQKIVEM